MSNGCQQVSTNGIVVYYEETLTCTDMHTQVVVYNIADWLEKSVEFSVK